MVGSYQKHLDEFGNCFDPQHTGIEMMRLESQNSRGRWEMEEVPACAECFGLK